MAGRAGGVEGGMGVRSNLLNTLKIYLECIVVEVVGYLPLECIVGCKFIPIYI